MISKSTIPHLFLFLILLSLTNTYYIKEGRVSSKIITNFTFGSNFYGRYSTHDNIFEKIISHNPDLWIWLGNAVYLDQPKFNYFQISPKSIDYDLIKSLYKKVKKDKFYSELSSTTPILGTWGDEEYGVINGNKENELKEGFKQYYLDFLDVDAVDIRRHNENLGIYSTYSFGKKDKTVRFIILDVKYDHNSYLNEGDNDMLGEKQWEWLEKLFKTKSETYTFICASNQILSNDRFIMKKWYADSRKKLFDLIGKYHKNGVIFLTGGLGFSQILKTFCPLKNIGYNLYEFTSSGLGHKNKLNSFLNNFYHNDYLIENTNYNDINFGQVKIHWGDKVNESYIEFEIYDKNDNLVSNVLVNYTQLMFRENSEYFYSDEKNLKEINYMNIHDDESCEREIYHRVRTPFMIIKYYCTHLTQLPVAIITSLVLIVFAETLFSKRFYYILIFSLLCFVCYCFCYFYDLNKYNTFKNQIISEN